MRRRRASLWDGGFSVFRLAFDRGGDGFEGGLVFIFEDVLERSCGGAVAVLDHLHAGDAGDKGHRTQRREGGGLHEDALDIEAFGFVVRNSCSITQRRR